MGYGQVIENIIKKHMLDLHTAYLGTVLSVSGNTAKVQPLGKIKGTDGTIKTQAVVSNVPIAAHKISKKKTTIDGESVDVAVVEKIKKGDIVVCIVCDRSITDAKRGLNTVPTIGHHSLSDSVIVGVL